MADKFIDISITGDKKLQRQLGKLDFALQRKIVRAAARKAMAPVRDRAKSYVPRETGELQKSIKIRSRTRRGISRIQVVTGTREQLGIDSNTPGYYPAAVEFGYTSTGGKQIAARPFLRRALGELKQVVITHFGAMVAAGIKAQVKK